MKKIWALITAILMTAMLCSCGALVNKPLPKSSDEQKQSQSTTVQPQPETEQSQPADDQPQQSQPTTTPEATISREEAIDIALKAAGVDSGAVFGIEAELDRERGGEYWEIEFETREYEYAYDINATDGTVARFDVEPND